MLLDPKSFAPSRHPIDRMSAADSIATILGRLDVERFPLGEQLAVATMQVAAIEEWLAAYLEAKGAETAPVGQTQRQH